MKRNGNRLAARTGYGLMILTLAFLAGGCAMGTTKLVVKHETLAGVTVRHQGNVLVRPFVDKREHTQYIGNKRNGFGMVLGHVALNGDAKLEELITQYFVEALQTAGYNARIDKTTPVQVPCDAVIDGEIVEFWMDLYMQVWHRVGVKVKATDPKTQSVTWEKLIEGAEQRTLWVGATGEFERVVREAVTKALNRAANEFASDDFYNRAVKKAK